MNEGYSETDWLTYNNFRYLCHINDIQMELFEDLRKYQDYSQPLTWIQG